MILSMTGYGKSECNNNGINIKIAVIGKYIYILLFILISDNNLDKKQINNIFPNSDGWPLNPPISIQLFAPPVSLGSTPKKNVNNKIAIRTK